MSETRRHTNTMMEKKNEPFQTADNHLRDNHHATHDLRLDSVPKEENLWEPLFFFSLRDIFGTIGKFWKGLRIRIY